MIVDQNTLFVTLIGDDAFLKEYNARLYLKRRRRGRGRDYINYLLLLEDIREKSWAGRRLFINEYSRIAISNYERMTMYLVKRRYIIHLYCYFFWLIIL